MTTLELAEMILGLRYESMPPEAIFHAKMRLMDYLGVLLAGQSARPSRQIMDAIGGRAALANPAAFALWCGSVARLVDLDDGHRFAMGHPGAPVVSAALAASIWERTDGRRLIEAIIRGYEVYGYLGRVVNPSAYKERGFDSTGTCGAVGAAVAAASVYGLDAVQTAHAIGIAGSLCGGLTQYFEEGSSPKYLCAGWAANLGVSSAHMARSHLTGPMRLIDGKAGFCQAFAPVCDAQYMNEPRIQWEVIQAYYKKYACVRRAHAALDCIELICLEEGVRAGDVVSVVVRGSKFVADGAKYGPKNSVDAQSSLPFCIAVLLTWGDVDFDILENAITDPAVNELARRVSIVEADEFNDLVRTNPSLWNAVSVQVIDTNGRIYMRRAELARGEMEKPFDANTLERKYLRLATKTLSEREAGELLCVVKALETVDDVSKVTLYVTQR